MMRNIEQSIIKPSPNNLNCKVQEPPTAVESIKKTPTCLSPNLLDSCFCEMDKRGIRFNGSSFYAVKPKILEPKISVRSTHKAKLQRFPPAPCPGNDGGATNFASTHQLKHTVNLENTAPMFRQLCQLRITKSIFDQSPLIKKCKKFVKKDNSHMY